MLRQLAGVFRRTAGLVQPFDKRKIDSANFGRQHFALVLVQLVPKGQ